MGSLVIITASNDDASKVYVKKKIEKGEALGHKVHHEHIKVEKDYEHVSLGECLRGAITMYNQDDKYDGILLQLPLCDELKGDTQKYIDMIDPKKDVDCLTTYNQGKIMLGDNSYLPCTTQAVMDMIESNTKDIKSEAIIVVGRSTLVTKPLTMASINAGYTVHTYCSNHTKGYIGDDLEHLLDLYNRVHFVSGIGKANYFDEDFIKSVYFNEDLYIYDIGMNRDTDGKLCGDVERDMDVAYQTPVPGGVGPKTVENVFKNLDKLKEAKC